MTNTERSFISSYDFQTVRENIQRTAPSGPDSMRKYHMLRGVLLGPNLPNPIVRANMVKTLFEDCLKYIPDGELIAGSLAGLKGNIPKESASLAEKVVNSFGFRSFWTNADHFAPNYERFLNDGIPGTYRKIEKAKKEHENDAEKVTFLSAMEIALEGLSLFIKGYSNEASKIGRNDIANVCNAITEREPKTFREALQLMSFVHTSFEYEGRGAQALGRIDQFLYPYYRRDIDSGELTYEEAVKLLMSAFAKLEGCIINIAIAGVKRDGTDATNELTYAVLEAVKRCNIPGPNLSARLHSNISDHFIDEALKVIGTGLGYPALMNDDVNIPALHRHGYTIEDARDYCMVGCIENFIAGKQPPWSDGRFNTPKYLEYALNNGRDMRTNELVGLETGDVCRFDSMDKLMEAVEKQISHGAALYVMLFNNYNTTPNPKNMTQPYLSIFCDDCIGRGMDINDGGAIYPSVHGACGMGIATVADSLAAIERVVYEEKYVTITELRNALIADFVGYENLQHKLLSAPKYGNNDDFVDKYAVWFVELQEKVFSKYHTRDGGPFYSLIASNTTNIPAGKELAATPDGRNAGKPLSDAASPAQGRDVSGPTAAALSLSKPDYSLVSGGTVVNQKYSPEMFRDPEKRARLGAMIRAYFKMGGQELQINSISRKVLQDAMDNPSDYKSLVVRVSGFSAYYIGQSRQVQEDILSRTEHE